MPRSGAPRPLAVVAAATVIVLAFFSRCDAEIRFTEIRSHDRPIIPIDEFGFTHRGWLELNASRIVLDPNPNPNPDSTLSNIGFFLCTRDSWFKVLKQIQETEISCALESDYIKHVYTFDRIGSSEDRFATVLNQDGANQYTLVFANCLSQRIRVSMDVDSAMYNLDGKNGPRDYLSAGKTVLPKIYFVFSLIYFVLAVVWIQVLYKKRLTVFTIHFFMLSVLSSRVSTCSARLRTRATLSAPAVPTAGTSCFTFSVSSRDKEKKVLMIVIPLQVIANIAQIIINETSPVGQEWATWKQVFLLVDVICCCAVLFPIVWSIKNLREAARTDGKAAVNLMKLTIFRHYYIVVICYIYFTRVVVFALETITSYRYAWTSVVAAELATLAFYAFMGYKFRPEVHNPYFTVDDEEEEAAAEVLKLEDEFEL